MTSWFQVAEVDKCLLDWDEGACHDEGDINGCSGCQRNGTRLVGLLTKIVPTGIIHNESGRLVFNFQEVPGTKPDLHDLLRQFPSDA